DCLPDQERSAPTSAGRARGAQWLRAWARRVCDADDLPLLARGALAGGARQARRRARRGGRLGAGGAGGQGGGGRLLLRGAGRLHVSRRRGAPGAAAPPRRARGRVMATPAVLVDAPDLERFGVEVLTGLDVPRD